ncbi:MAG TPA: hypothetical protein VJ901_02690 [Thermoanaerobaculia bacterium]|nr:hypothetical protein [Thermoanaerobaculia bacterium]
MPYQVQFVGLVCFFNEPGGKRALLPDGRNPGKDVMPHAASIVIDDPAKIIRDRTTGLSDEQITSGEFVLSQHSILHLSGAEAGGAFDPTDLDATLPNLSDVDNDVRIDPAKAIAQVPINTGTLAPFRFPGTPDDGTAALITQLKLKYDGEITITVEPHGGRAKIDQKDWPTITLNAGTEIAIVNASRSPKGPGKADEPEEHFHIYGELSSKAVNLKNVPVTPHNIPLSQSTHRVFDSDGIGGHSIGGGSAKCSNTGCCRPVVGGG